MPGMTRSTTTTSGTKLRTSTMAASPLDASPTTSRFVEAGETGRDTLSKQVVIVDDDDANVFVGRHTPATDSRTSVPRPGDELISSLAPTASARSRMMIEPKVTSRHRVRIEPAGRCPGSAVRRLLHSSRESFTVVGLRMFGDVAERLLGDSVEREPRTGVELDRLDVDGHLQRLATLERGHQALEQLVEGSLRQLRRTQFEHQRPHLRQRTTGQLTQPLEPRPQRRIVSGFAEQTVGRQRRGPQRLIDGVVQLACETLALLGGSEPGDLTSETSVGNRRCCLTGDCTADGRRGRR